VTLIDVIEHYIDSYILRSVNFGYAVTTLVSGAWALHSAYRLASTPARHRIGSQWAQENYQLGMST
jgi:hypothetical protein